MDFTPMRFQCQSMLYYRRINHAIKLITWYSRSDIILYNVLKKKELNEKEKLEKKEKKSKWIKLKD